MQTIFTTPLEMNIIHIMDDGTFESLFFIIKGYTLKTSKFDGINIRDELEKLMNRHRPMYVGDMIDSSIPESLLIAFYNQFDRLRTNQQSPHIELHISVRNAPTLLITEHE
jgi:flagellar basal body L-ring protein FlgH